MLGQALRRSGAASRLLSPCGPSSSSALAQQLAQQLQQQAGFAKKGGETVDSRLQKVLKMLEPREVEDIEISEEDYAEGVRRCGRRRRRRQRRCPKLSLCSLAGSAGACRGTATFPVERWVMVHSASLLRLCATWLSYVLLLPGVCRAKEYSRLKMKEHREWQVSACFWQSRGVEKLADKKGSRLVQHTPCRGRSLRHTARDAALPPCAPHFG